MNAQGYACRLFLIFLSFVFSVNFLFGCAQAEPPPPTAEAPPRLAAPPPPPPARVPARGPVPGSPPTPAIEAPKQGERYPLWYATNRQPIDKRDEGKGYSTESDTRVHYGKVFVDIPEDYLEELRNQSWLDKLLSKSPETELKVQDPMPLSLASFTEDIRDELNKSRRPDERIALIYLHGFRTSFVEAAQRAASIGYQLKIPVTAFFSWPSKDTVEGYLADKSSIEGSEEEIAAFLTTFVRESHAHRVHLIAHSMGNYGLLRAMYRPLMQAAIRNGVQFGQIILAAPDIDARLFIRDAPIYRRVAERVTLYASSNDRALNLSRKFQDFARAGFMPPATVVPGIDTLDVTLVNLTSLGHAYIAEEITVLQDMHALIAYNTPPNRRSHIIPSESREYWILK